MRRHWQKKPLLVRGAIVDFKPLLSRAELFALACSDGVESRLIVKNGDSWRMKSGPFTPRGLPALGKPGWTLLVQGVDRHASAVHQFLQQFRFVPDARLDDVMISFATPAGGVGPHFDSYDVFLLQASGQRRWKISQQKDLSLQAGVPLKILQNFEVEQEFVLEAGDMLYLPPGYAHDGVAEACAVPGRKADDCMTYSIGFKAPSQKDMTIELLHKLAEFTEDDDEDGRADLVASSKAAKMYRDSAQAATATPALVPTALAAFAENAVRHALKNPKTIACALGEILSSPKASVWFAEPTTRWVRLLKSDLFLDSKTRMMYDQHHLFINGESFLAKGADARLMRRLADQRMLGMAELAKATPGALDLLRQWHGAGWLHVGKEA